MRQYWLGMAMIYGGLSLALGIERATGLLFVVIGIAVLFDTRMRL